MRLRHTGPALPGPPKAVVRAQRLYVKRTTFRLGALLLGIGAVTSTILVYRLFWVSVVVGLLFGAGGWLIDNFTGFRKLGGQLSSWALAAGGAIVGVTWQRGFRFDDVATHSSWPSFIQYAGVVLICWGVLMYIGPKTRDEPK